MRLATGLLALCTACGNVERDEPAAADDCEVHCASVEACGWGDAQACTDWCRCQTSALRDEAVTPYLDCLVREAETCDESGVAEIEAFCGETAERVVSAVSVGADYLDTCTCEPHPCERNALFEDEVVQDLLACEGDTCEDVLHCEESTVAAYCPG